LCCIALTWYNRSLAIYGGGLIRNSSESKWCHEVQFQVAAKGLEIRFWGTVWQYGAFHVRVRDSSTPMESYSSYSSSVYIVRESLLCIKIPYFDHKDIFLTLTSVFPLLSLSLSFLVMRFFFVALLPLQARHGFFFLPKMIVFQLVQECYDGCTLGFGALCRFLCWRKH